MSPLDRTGQIRATGERDESRRNGSEGATGSELTLRT